TSGSRKLEDSSLLSPGLGGSRRLALSPTSTPPGTRAPQLTSPPVQTAMSGSRISMATRSGASRRRATSPTLPFPQAQALGGHHRRSRRQRLVRGIALGLQHMGREDRSDYTGRQRYRVQPPRTHTRADGHHAGS